MSNKVRNISKILFFMIVVAICLVLTMPKSDAASFSITSGISSITVGNSYTISISAKGLTGKFNISHSSNVSVNVSSVWVENGNADSTIKVTTKKEGEATVTITPETVADSSGNDVALSAKTDRVTVKAKSSSGGSSGSSSSNGSSSGSGNSSNSSSEETTKTEALSFITVNETVYATDSVNVRSSYSTSSSIIGSLNKGDSITRIGKSSSWSKVKYNGQTAYVSSDYLDTEKPEESNNKNLKSLTISGDYELTPKFDKDVTEYTLNVGSDINSIDIKANAEDSSAKVEITGNDKLLAGENTIEIKVTAEDGTVRTYKINVTKGETTTANSGIELSELSINGYNLTPEFTSGIYEYKLDIADPSITSLNVNAKSNNENAVIEIAGNDELKLGENIITILLKAKDGEEEKIVTYQIVVNISEKTEENNQIIAGINNKELYMYGGIGLGIIIILIIIITVVKRRKREEDDDFEPYYADFSSLNTDINSQNQQNKFEEKNGIEENINTSIENSVDLEKTKNNNDFNFEDSRNSRKSVIQENFGADINYSDFDEDKPKRKKGKHF